MSIYDYHEGKKRVIEILNDENEIQKSDVLPYEKELKFDNGYYGWASAIFVDIRDSVVLFAENTKTSTARIIRCFTSEIIEILNDDSLNLREIGIRGDCVYAIYSIDTIDKITELFKKAYTINSFIKMLNNLLKEGMPKIKAGIGISMSKDLLIKAGRKFSGINGAVWIGKAVTFASKLSNMALKNGKGSILMNDIFYNSIIKVCKTYSGYNNSWFNTYYDNKLGWYFSCDLYNKEFDEWIDGGMNE